MGIETKKKADPIADVGYKQAMLQTADICVLNKVPH
jgi:hypothetical protein